SYENNAYHELQSLVRLIRVHPLPITSLPVQTPDEISVLHGWVSNAAKSGARVTIIASDGRVLADSDSEPGTMENHAGREEVTDALQKGEGRSIRESVSVKRPLIYYAVRENLPDGTPIVLRLALPMEGMDESLAQFRASLWLWSLLIFLIAGAVALFMSRTYADRVERLREFSLRVAEGDFRPLSADGTGDTLEALSSSLNQTASRLDRTIRTLTEERNLSSAILASMVEGVLVVNAEESVVFANYSFAEILDMGVPPQAGSGLVEWVRQTELIEAVRRVLAGEPRVESEIVTGTRGARFFGATGAR